MSTSVIGYGANEGCTRTIWARYVAQLPTRTRVYILYHTSLFCWHVFFFFLFQIIDLLDNNNEAIVKFIPRIDFAKFGEPKDKVT